MQLTSFLPIALLSTTLGFVSGVPMRRDTSPALTWHVSNFDAGCSPGGCAYHFNILGVASQNTPGFNTTCAGTVTDKNKDNYQSCQDKGVRAKLSPRTAPKWTVGIEHLWERGGNQEFYAFGNANITKPIKTFDINVTKEFGVA